MFGAFSWGGQAIKECPTDGCQNSILASQKMCNGCLQKQRARDDSVGVHLWAIQGFKDMRVYLAAWAKFEEKHGPN